MTRIFELQGHRGARGLFPENTLEGFEGAIAIGVDTIELDVAVTADGVAVVTHDPVLNPDITRGPDGAWLDNTGPAIRALTLAQLRRYDVGRLRPGSRYAGLYPDQAPRDGARIPTLAEVFALTRAAGVRIDAEVKTLPDRPDLTVPPADMADIIVATAEAAGALPRLVVRSFDWRGLRHLRRRRPEIPLVWLTSAETVAHAALWWDGPTPAAFGGSVPAAVAAEAGSATAWTPAWAPEYRTLVQDQIAEAHQLGLRVIPWTVNAAADMARLIAWKADGLCTDRPDVARAALAAIARP
ncbi:glycerophosphodiester phosphodiesterase [Limobrevibacterium gyesilva]|uniref:Glycerophosphodiester phosphodiesterase n=1 Tax=Limobrevibacterium gyesilva TaxID=2991712 RepID=A0AA42CGX9_9PROT|nr:glycerophosphodiester phosphodiesterase [Limobrevibacterium gyesilva]MCW3474422.1 glycerophosphodiester phosphodiesterase [Limobrevibacterium gyesilva]